MTAEDAAPTPEVSVTYRNLTNLGDHGEYVTRAVALDGDETVRDLARRLLAPRWDGDDTYTDSIEIRIVKPAPEKPTPDPWKPGQGPGPF